MPMNESQGGTPIHVHGLYGDVPLNSYCFCLSESGAGLQISVSAGTGYAFCHFDSGTRQRLLICAARIVLQTNVVAVCCSCPASCLPKCAVSNSKVNHISHFSVWNRVSISPFCLEQGSKILSL